MRTRIRFAIAGGAIAAALATAAFPVVANDADPGPLEETTKALDAVVLHDHSHHGSEAHAPTSGPDVVVDPDWRSPRAAEGGPSLTHLGNHPGTTGGHVSIEGDRLYVGAYGLGMRYFDISDPANPVEIGRWTAAEAPNKHPRADAVPDATVINGRHIVALGGTRRLTQTDLRTDVTDFVDTTDPAAPKLLARFVGPDDGESHNSDIVDGRALWLPTGGSNRVEGEKIVSRNGLRIYSLRPLLRDDPAKPRLLGRWDPVQLWRKSPYREGRRVGPAFTHSHDVTVYEDHRVRTERGWVIYPAPGYEGPMEGTDVIVERRDIAILAEGGNYTDVEGNTGSIFIIDITDPRHPVVLNRWLHTTADGHHPIRYYHEAQLLDGDPRTMIVTDEDLHSGCDAGGATIVRLSADLTRAREVAEWFNGAGTPAPVCSTHVFSSIDEHLFIGSYNAGLQVVDLSDPRHPVAVAESIPPGANSWGALVHRAGKRTYVYLGDFGGRGLDVYRVDGS